MLYANYTIPYLFNLVEKKKSLFLGGPLKGLNKTYASSH